MSDTARSGAAIATPPRQRSASRAAAVDDWIKVRFLCEHPHCQQNQTHEYRDEIPRYQLSLVAIWWHTAHEGHLFSYWEDGDLILGQGDVPLT